MKVIFAGYSKTGTKTMTSAFNILGYKTYDWMEHYWFHNKEWTKIWEKGCCAEDFKKMYENVDAVTDAPPHFFWEQILEAFPDTKVILPVRDDKEWYKSLKKQVHETATDRRLLMIQSLTPSGWSYFFHIRYIFKMYGATMHFPWSYINIFNGDIMRRIYREHNLYVQTKCPPKQLLLFHIKDGWDPICKFLDLPTPTQPFPHKNKGSNVLNELRVENTVMIKLERELKSSLTLMAIIVAFVLFQFI